MDMRRMNMFAFFDAANELYLSCPPMLPPPLLVVMEGLLPLLAAASCSSRAPTELMERDEKDGRLLERGPVMSTVVVGVNNMDGGGDCGCCWRGPNEAEVRQGSSFRMLVCPFGADGRPGS